MQPSGCICRTATLGAHVIWYDNFTKYRYAQKQIPSMEDGAFLQQLWTGRAFRCSRTPVDMRVCRDMTGAIIPAMPDDPMIMLDTIVSACQTYSPSERLLMQKHSKSLITIWKVHNVPLCPHPSAVSKPAHASAIRNHSDGMENMYPDTILPVNIGANKSFLRLMREHYESRDQHQADECPEYSVFATDIDIANKQLRVQRGGEGESI